MATRTAKPHLVILALLGLTSVALAIGVDISLTDQAGVRAQLPPNLANWSGNEMRYCLNKPCQAQFYANSISNRLVCPNCTNKLDGLTWVERGLLPADTEGMRTRYTAPDGRSVFNTGRSPLERRGGLAWSLIVFLGGRGDAPADLSPAARRVRSARRRHPCRPLLGGRRR